jgi:hypothetical protein
LTSDGGGGSTADFACLAAFNFALSSLDCFCSGSGGWELFVADVDERASIMASEEEVLAIRLLMAKPRALARVCLHGESDCTFSWGHERLSSFSRAPSRGVLLHD